MLFCMWRMDRRTSDDFKSPCNKVQEPLDARDNVSKKSDQGLLLQADVYTDRIEWKSCQVCIANVHWVDCCSLNNMKFANLILILASVLTVTAFSLERRAGHAQVTRISQVLRLKTNSFPARRTTTSLLEAERTSEGIANTVAAAETKPSLLASIWNENTKLSFYLLVWYMGNIYCK